ncbi:MAG: replicative DNA helicase [Devosia sp. 67-54]|uniref:replicative DNA helicase n=1 Tax=unclassified Devosia TaxID=196773 RepID=UPI00096879FF|nr:MULTISPECIES: replicative DNA helicase [unclassified Devosia]MBN9306494.1 replicative DNA helicase [Devosia sp.]OJX18541.1 MAG: replicative DNA helicase [Devosia sp. 67-54]
MVDSNVARIRPADEKSFRLAPHNIEAEQALLGAILVNNEAFYRVSDFLLPEHFYEPVHREIYEVAGKIVRAGKAATPITVKTYLPDRLVADVTMQQYLSRLAAEATTVINANDYGQTVYDLAIRRTLIQIGEEMVSTAYDADVEMTAPKQIEEAEKSLFDLAEKGRYDGGFMGFNEALTEAIKMAGEAYQRDGRLSGIATGLIDMDRQMGGLQKSDLVIIAGRPGMAKTSLATTIGFHVASQWQGEITPDGHRKTVNGGQVGFFSLEMSAEQLATRILSAQAEISSADIRRGNIHESQFSRLVDVSNMLAQVPLYIDDTGGLSVAQLAARARRLKRQKGLDLIIIDYIQLLSGSSKRASENRVQEITEITTTLKALAKELDVPIIALSQLSRQVESRDDKRPQLSDLRESGSIEQDADVVLFIYREEYYLKNKEPREGTPEHITWIGEMEKVHGRAEIIIGKQRHGPTGTVQLSFEGQYTRFGNLAPDQYLPERYE